MVDGTLFLTMPFNHMAAIDAAMGQPRWRYQRNFRAGISGSNPGGPAHRGAAIGYGAVYHATNDGRLLALDQKTGKVIWEVVSAEPSAEELRALASSASRRAAYSSCLLFRKNRLGSVAASAKTGPSKISSIAATRSTLSFSGLSLLMGKDAPEPQLGKL